MASFLTIVAFTIVLTSSAVRGQQVALVLSGGGARCITQVGVLKVLEREGIVPDMIIGSSFGGIVGGLYCAGYSAHEIDSIFRVVDWDDIASIREASQREYQFLSQKYEGDRSILTLRFNDFSFVPPTAIGGNTRFSYLLQRLLWESPFNNRTDFDQLMPRLRVVATNLADGRPKILNGGNLATAIRASATFPLRYSPVRWDDTTVLVDGGLVANIPTEVARQSGATTIILVNSTSRLSSLDEIQTPWAVADQSLSAAMMQKDSLRLSLADVVIEPELDQWNTFSFTNIDSLIRLGELAAEQALPRLRSIIDTKRSEMINSAAVDVINADGDSILAKHVQVSLAQTIEMLTERDLHRRVSRQLHAAGYQLGYITRGSGFTSSGRYRIVIDKGLINERTFKLKGSRSSVTLAKESAFADSANFTVERLSRAWQNLHAADALAESDISIGRIASGGNAVEVAAIGNGNQAIRLGARVDNERYTQGSIELVYDNVLFPSFRLITSGVLSERIGSLFAGFDVPRIAGSLWTTSLRGYTSFRNVWAYSNRTGRPGTVRLAEYSEDRYGMRFSAGRQLERNGVVLAELRYENQRYRNLKDSIRPVFQPLATVRAVARWDDRDNIAFPTKGRTIDVSAETSVLSLSNGLSFTKLTASVSSVFNARWFTIVPSVLIGAADKTLPSSELFSIGGQDMFFGMREDQQRGRQIAVGNLEVRTKMPFSIFFDTYLSVRYDIGAVWEVPEFIRIADMNHGLGVTLAVDTPIGPARVSAGRAFAFQERPNKVLLGTPLAYFSIGVRL